MNKKMNKKEGTSAAAAAYGPNQVPENFRHHRDILPLSLSLVQEVYNYLREYCGENYTCASMHTERFVCCLYPTRYKPGPHTFEPRVC